MSPFRSVIYNETKETLVCLVLFTTRNFRRRHPSIAALVASIFYGIILTQGFTFTAHFDPHNEPEYATVFIKITSTTPPVRGTANTANHLTFPRLTNSTLALIKFDSILVLTSLLELWLCFYHHVWFSIGPRKLHEQHRFYKPNCGFS
jgi:hypothetical protein